MKRIAGLIFLFCLFAVGSVRGFAQASIPVIVNVDTGAGNVAVPSRFQGLSFEIRTIMPDEQGAHYYDPKKNPSLVNLFKTLGIANIRFGGTALDEKSFTISHADIDNLFAFAKAIGAKVIYSLRLKNFPGEDKQKQYQTETADVQYIMGKYPDLVDCFCLGNEPNVYYKKLGDFELDWQRFTAIINAACPEAKFCGPGAFAPSWIVPFAQQFAKDGNLAYVTEHIYTGGGDGYRLPRDKNAKPGDQTPGSNALNQAPLDPEKQQIVAGLQAKARAQMLARLDFTSYYKAFGPALKELGMKYRIEETNSFNHGGVANASNAYSASLWGLNYEWWWASHGADGINLHTGTKNSTARVFTNYSTFESGTDGGQTPLGLSYALLAFKMASNGRIVDSNMDKSQGKINLTGYSLTGSDGSVYVTLINMEFGPAGHEAAVDIKIPGYSVAHVQTIALAQSSGDVSFKPGTATPGSITLGNASIEPNGLWNGKWNAPTGPVDAHSIHVTVPEASALIVKLSS